jgi:hypothetical protein
MLTLNKIFILFLSFLLSFCGPSEEEIASRVEEAIQDALDTSTTTSNPATTTTTTLSTSLPEERSYEDNILNFNQYLIINQIDSTVYEDSYYIRFKAKWNRVNRVYLIFEDECEALKRPDNKEQVFSSTLGININNGNSPCIDSNEIIAIYIEGLTDSGGTKFTTFYKNGYYTNYKYEKKHIENSDISYCCHKIDFEKINYELNNLKDSFKNPTASTTTTSTTTTSTTTTSTTTTSTTTTSTTTTTLYTDNEAPTWPNKEVSIANINPTYFEVIWNTASDNVNVAGYKFYLNNQLKGEYVRNNDNNSIFLDGLTSGTTYNLEIVAYDDAGNTSTNNPSKSITTSSSNQSNTTTTTIPFICEGNEQNDAQPPILVSSNIDKTTVDVSQNSVVVTITMNITDNCVGVATGFNGPTVSVESIGFASTGRTSGDDKNGTWTSTITIPQEQSNGSYKVSLFPLEDNNGNSGMFATLGYIQVDW